MRVTKILKTSSDVFAFGYLLYEIYFGVALQEQIKRLLKTVSDFVLYSCAHLNYHWNQAAEGRELDAEMVERPEAACTSAVGHLS